MKLNKDGNVIIPRRYQIGFLSFGRGVLTDRFYFHIEIIRNPVLIWLLNKLFGLLLRLPYSMRASRAMWWILAHTPADENETK
jgi:hypothetical protein